MMISSAMRAIILLAGGRLFTTEPDPGPTTNAQPIERAGPLDPPREVRRGLVGASRYLSNEALQDIPTRQQRRAEDRKRMKTRK